MLLQETLLSLHMVITMLAKALVMQCYKHLQAYSQYSTLIPVPITHTSTQVTQCSLHFAAILQVLKTDVHC